MNKNIKLLAAIALLQVVLIVWGWNSRSALPSHSVSNRLLDFQPAQVDALSISDSDHTVTLKKVAGKWQTPSGFAADQGKLKGLLDKLQGLKYSLPVATSAGALKRFKVATDHFERHIVLQQQGKTLAELYLGSGAGARQSYVRNAQQNAVYSAAIGSYDAPAQATDWQDKTVLTLNADKISTLTVGDMKFQRAKADGKTGKAGKWQALNAPQDHTFDASALQAAVQKLATLRFSKLLGKPGEARYGLDKPLLKLSLQSDQLKRDYRFGKLKDSQDYVLKVSDRDEYFQIASYLGDGIVQGLDSDKLFKPVAVQSDSKAAPDKSAPAKAEKP